MKKILVLIFVLVLVGCTKPGTKSDPKEAVPAATWHTLAIGQQMHLGSYESVRRVPGGWVYCYWIPGTAAGVCFVPYSDEGKEKSW